MPNWPGQVLTEQSQQSLLGAETISAPGVAVTPTFKLGSYTITWKPVQAGDVVKPRGSWAAGTFNLTKDETTLSFSSDAPDYEETLPVALMTVVGVDPATGNVLTPTASGTNGRHWLLRWREGNDNPTLSFTGQFGNTTRHQQIAGISGSKISVEVSGGERRSFKISADAIGGQIRDKSDGGTPSIPAFANTTGTLPQYPKVPVDPSSICVYTSWVSMADLVTRTAKPVTHTPTLAGGDTAAALATALETAIETSTAVDGGDVTVVGAGGPLGTAAVTLTVTWQGKYANMPMDTILLDTGGLTAGNVSVAHTTIGSDTQNDVQTITITQNATGPVGITADHRASVRMGGLAGYSWSIGDRQKNWHPVNCRPDATLNLEGLSDDISFKHIANDHGMRMMQKVRGTVARSTERRMWVLMETNGPAIDGATPSQYQLRIWSCMFVTGLTDMPIDAGIQLCQWKGALASDSAFAESAPGTWNIEGFTSWEIVNTLASV